MLRLSPVFSSFRLPSLAFLEMPFLEGRVRVGGKWCVPEAILERGADALLSFGRRVEVELARRLYRCVSELRLHVGGVGPCQS